MKKFLFTLAAVLMAGSLCAGEYFQCADYEIPTDQIGKNVNIDVKAHFDAYVSAWQSEVILPENLTLVGVKKGADMTLTFFDEFGDETSTAPDVTRQGNKLIVACMAASYSEDGDYYGVAKWAPGDYDQMMILVVKATEEFQGGEIKIVTDFSCGEDTREDVNNNRSNEKGAEGVSEVTAEWAGGSELQDLTGEIVIGTPTDEGKVSITYTGPEDVTILVVVNGVETPIDEDGNIQIQEGRSIIVVTVEAEGYNPKSVTGEIEWTKPEPPVTEKTPDPVINYDEETFTVTVEGEGSIHVYVDGEEVTNPYTFEQGEEDVTYVITATAQEDGKEISETVELVVVVPGTGGEPGPEPEEGIFLILIDQFGNEVPYPLNEGSDGDYTTTVTLKYYPWGEFYWDPELTDEENEANRPNVPFYFMINGQRYGAEELTATVLGYALQNPLTEGAEDYYYVPVGYSYTLGVAFNDGIYYVYAAISKPTGLDELNGEKAVAGVRYFNLAGQEMQEANGMTIVVTTYTDGTTSAVKVMK